ncbi:MAG: hypothetical protein MAG451_01100 [Anaerolineales bacterium]|nr:hypothetical protein [Anaerolineales bacterium]
MPKTPQAMKMTACGLTDQVDAKVAVEADADAILVGETLVTAEDTAAKVRELCLT